MTEERPHRRPFQFSLRKLMLWTAMLAVFLGILQLLHFDAGSIATWACWAVVVAIVRLKQSPWRTFWCSALGGALLVYVVCLCVSLAGVPIYAFWPSAALFGGFLYGGILFTLVEAAYRLVQWLDGLMETK